MTDQWPWPGEDKEAMDFIFEVSRMIDAQG